MTFSSLLMKGSPNAGDKGECHFRFKNCEIIDDGEEYSWRYGKVTDMIYFFSQPVDNSYTKYRDPLLHTAVYIEDKGTGVKVKEVTQDYPELVEWNEYMDNLRV